MKSASYTTDTSPEAQAVQLEYVRNMSPQQRLRKSCALSGQVRKMAIEAIRRRHPGLDGRELQLRLIELVYGKQLADEVANWQAERQD